jgi:hypothetical protein
VRPGDDGGSEKDSGASIYDRLYNQAEMRKKKLAEEVSDMEKYWMRLEYK